MEGNRRNVLLVTFETTRADHLSSYGYERETSPGLDHLSAEGTLFENCSSVSPRTNPSLASLMTGRYPHEHGVRNLLLPLEPEEKTLAEILRDAGYRTAAVQTHPRLVRGSGMAQGFTDYMDDYRKFPLAEQAARVAEDWIRKHGAGERPWFLWLHLMDPHWTYDPPAEFRTRFGVDDPRPGRFYRDLTARTRIIGPAVFENTMPADEVQAYVDFYDAEIAYTDASFSAMLERLTGDGLLDETVTIVTADHGESLGEHDYFFEHGDFGHQPEIHIPLILHGPGLAAGRRIPATVSNIDIAPTVLDLVEVRSIGSFRGRSLVPLLHGETEDRPSFGETGKRFHEQNRVRALDGIQGKWRWMRRGDFKMVHRPLAEGSFERFLYRLSDDPGESVDVQLKYPEVARRLGIELDVMLAEDPGKGREYHISEEAEAILRSLGYVN